jgi:pimeloyl-ACP methyl ester carboxylesterase
MKAHDIDGTRLFYRQAGSGTPVILLHGSASSGAQWKDTIDHLRTRHRVITPDLPGYGGSQVDPSRPVDSLDSDAQAIIELIEKVGEPVHLVGHSFGASVAIKVAMNAGHLVRSLTVFEPALFHLLRDGDANDRAIHGEIAHIEAMLAACAQDDDAPAGMAQFIDFWNGEGTWERLTPNVQDMYASEIGHVLRDFATGARETWGPADAERIDCPTFAYMGLESQAVSQRTTEIMAEAIPNASLTMVADADHMAPMTHAHILAPALKRHFEAVEASECSVVAFDTRQAA